MNEMKRQILEYHNSVRKIHGAQPLKFSRKLTQAAQKWADHLSQIGKFKHDDKVNFGVNLGMYSGPKVSSKFTFITILYLVRTEIRSGESSHFLVRRRKEFQLR